jgi:LAO/AO transport system kinase
MVDFFLLLIQPGSGDELQGIKKGIVEMADAIAVTKTDGDSIKAAKATQADFQHAMHIQHPQRSGWTPKVLTCSALHNTGLREIANLIESYQQKLTASGFLEANRRDQNRIWFRDRFQYLLMTDPDQFPDVVRAEKALQEKVQSGSLSPRQAAQELLDEYHKAIRR